MVALRNASAQVGLYVCQEFATLLKRGEILAGVVTVMVCGRYRFICGLGSVGAEVGYGVSGEGATVGEGEGPRVTGTITYIMYTYIYTYINSYIYI